MSGLQQRALSLLTRWRQDPAFPLVQSPLFWVILLLKLALGSVVASYYMRDLFTPFLNYFIESGFSNPWSHFADVGRTNSFPYPPFMLYVLAIPRWLFSPLLADGIDTVTMAHLLVMRLPLLACDVVIAVILARWFPNRLRRVLLLYWCSPFVIYICYWHGQLDIIPTTVFLYSLYLLKDRRYAIAMAVFGIALATKSHLLVALPFMLVYVFQERGAIHTMRVTAIALAVYVVSLVPYLLDPAFREMVYRTQEQARLFAFQLPMGSSDLAILVAPAAIVLLWFRFVAYSRRNWDLFMLYLGILFAVFILLAPPAPGYVLWSLPFLIHFMCRAGKANVLPYVVYAAAYLGFFWLGSQSDLMDGWRVVSAEIAGWPTPYEMLNAWRPGTAVTVENLAFTAMQTSLAGLVLAMYLFGVRSNAVYRMRTMPVLIGLAGDSGSGKDTFVKLAMKVLGKDRVTPIAGDDYHRWPRAHEMWQVYTHLDVRGSDLYQQHEDAVALSQGKSIVKGTYDHQTGQFSERQALDASEYVVFSGLHSLSIEALRNLFDLRVFLDPDEDLRRRWKLRRDRTDRGYQAPGVLEAIEGRQPDRERYILPQRDHADVVVRWIPETAVTPQDGGDPKLALEILALNSFNFTHLVQSLRNFATGPVEHEPFSDARWQRLRLSIEISPQTLRTICSDLVPNLQELSAAPSFAPDLNGCLQMVFLVCLSEKLRWTAPRG